MEVRDIEQVTTEGTNAGGDEVEATSAREADADSTIAELVSRARAAMGIFEHYDQERVDEVVQTLAWATNPVMVQGAIFAGITITEGWSRETPLR